MLGVNRALVRFADQAGIIHISCTARTNWLRNSALAERLANPADDSTNLCCEAIPFCFLTHRIFPRFAISVGSLTVQLRKVICANSELRANGSFCRLRLLFIRLFL